MGVARFRAQLCAADGKIPADARQGAPLNGDEGGLRFAGRFFHAANFLHIPMVIGGGICYDKFTAARSPRRCELISRKE